MADRSECHFHPRILPHHLLQLLEQLQAMQATHASKQGRGGRPETTTGCQHPSLDGGNSLNQAPNK